MEVEIVDGLQRLMRNARRGKRECIRKRSSVEVAIKDNAVGSYLKQLKSASIT